MSRVVHARIHGAPSNEREAIHRAFEALTAAREWRDEPPWLADATSSSVLAQLYFDDVRNARQTEEPESTPPSAATFVRVSGDETDALALMFVLRELSERFSLVVAIRDPDNPIAKMRTIDLRCGLLPDGGQLEELLVRRPIFKKMRDGSRIEMYPPRALGSAFGTKKGRDAERRDWGFLVFGMRDERPTFLEAEAEALRIYHGLRNLQ